MFTSIETASGQKGINTHMLFYRLKNTISLLLQSILMFIPGYTSILYSKNEQLQQISSWVAREQYYGLIILV